MLAQYARPARSAFAKAPADSDNIRIIWAYIEGLLELASEFALNHPGLIIFDEPRQQEAKEVSFEKLLVRATKTLSRHQQVLFLTSEPLANIHRMTNNLDVKIINIEGWVMKRL